MKKNYSYCFLAMLFSFLISSAAYAQGTFISGKVLDAETNESLIGANIIIKGKVIGTTTDIDGNFRLNTTVSLPFTIVVSVVGYTPQEVEITANNQEVEVKLSTQAVFGQEVVISASRVEENLLQAPVAIEKMDILDIRNTAAPSFYDALANLKGVDFSTQSLTFKSVNARGFGSNGNVRFVQLIDGIDNQAPGLNFPVGNVVGISDLDLESAEMIPGAASALYGPNALNGILLLRSKSPFDYQGLSATAKVGVNHIDGEDDDPSVYHDYSIRYAKAFNNKFAVKLTASYLRANDFKGVDTRDQSNVVERGANERGNNRFYDGVNTYGDFLIDLGRIADIQIAGGGATAAQLQAVRALIPNGAAGAFTPTGFLEGDFVDNKTESLKFGTALHYRLNDNLELLGQFNYGRGSTVYTANDRFVLDGFSIWTGKLELKSNNFFIRAYTTQENSGDTYAANTVASLINQSTYLSPYFSTYLGARTSNFFLTNEELHGLARQAADAAQPQPGSPAFNQLFNQFRGIPISEGGAKFLDKSALWHFETSYNFEDKISFADVVVGANFRRYDLNSEGTLFALENDGNEVNIDEWGTYLQASKSLANNVVKLQGSIRYDKNENFEGVFSPRFSSVFKIADKHYLRGSFQRAFRIPSTQDQFIDLDVVTRRLLGRNDLVVNRYNLRTNTVYSTTDVDALRSQVANGQLSVVQAAQQLQPENEVNTEYKTEKVNTFEVGYKSVLMAGKLSLDGYYYFSRYNDFGIEIDLTQAYAITSPIQAPAGFNPNSQEGKEAIIAQNVPLQRFGFDTNASTDLDVQGWAFQIDYSLPKGYKIGGNVSFNKLIDANGLSERNTQFNTPEYRYNLSFSNRKVTKNMGFNVSWRWQQAYIWGSAFGRGVIPEFGTLDAQVSFKLPNIKSIVKVGGSNVLNERYTTSYGNPRLGSIFYISLTYDEFLN